MTTPKYVFFSLLFLPLLLATSAGAAGIETIQKVVQKYNAKEAIKMDVEKTAVMSLLEERKESKGVLYYSKGRMRLEIQEPEKSTIVMNDQAIWVETIVSGWSENSVHVTKITSKDMKNQSRAPLAMLLSKEKIWNEFKVLSEKTKGDLITVNLEPKNKAAMADVASLTVVVDKKKLELRKLSYKDDIDNEMIYDLKSPDYGAKISAGKFQYEPPKDAEVVVY